ncbi:MAG: sugar transferase [Anderseniella sp.]
MKRFLDIVVAGVAMLVLLPVMALVALLIAMKLGRPVLFRQVRPGLNGEPFEMIKFRSMSDARDGNGTLLSDEDRLGSFGKFLRSSSLDELPELWNVLKGDMSLVGPRPLLMRYLPLYNDRQKRRHDVRPGITGWAQINGRNALSWEDKFEHDVWYVENRSFWLDMKILVHTLVSVLSRENTSADGHATMPEFTGVDDQGSHTGIKS